MNNLLFFVALVNCYFVYSQTSVVPNIAGGDGFIQIGEFRIGNVDDTHFSISSKNNKKTAIIFRNDGTVHPGPRNDFGLWGRPLLGTPQNVQFTDNGIEFNAIWCIGISALNGNGQSHLSISHNNGAGADKTAMIWREDGTRHSGPRDDYSCWNPAYSNDVTISTDSNGRTYIQFDDDFRIGDTGKNINGQSHLSIVSKKTAVIYRDDGTIHPGPRSDWAPMKFDWAPFY